MDSTRKVISDVLGSLNISSLDDRISYRRVLSILNDKLRKFIKQDSDSRKLFKLSEGWKRIPCLTLKEIDMIECGFDIPHCKTLMKSVKKIPEVFQTTYGNMLKVMTLDGTKEFVQTTFPAYKDIANREYKNPNTIYFILLEGNIYIPDREIEEVSLYGLFKNPFEVTKLIDPDAKCLKPLDEKFPCPDYLLDAVKSDTGVELMKKYESRPPDQKADLNVYDKGQK